MKDDIDELCKSFFGCAIDELSEIPTRNSDPPIKLSFREFIDMDYDEGYHNLYIVWYKETALYVGISNWNIWDRWFSRSNCHMLKLSGGWSEDWSSSIGRCIIQNLPESLDWIIELRHYPNTLLFNKAPVDLDNVEQDLIYEYRPLFNIRHRPKLSESERKLKHSLVKQKVIRVE
jgi:hypothetical protein